MVWSTLLSSSTTLNLSLALAGSLCIFASPGDSAGPSHLALSRVELVKGTFRDIHGISRDALSMELEHLKQITWHKSIRKTCEELRATI